ncbi:hypothetical protein [Candidatus Bandiella euplotis]|uniref:Uncharacterized protein n=1 Tax=Candidatus Bandiella euplotis TaxID=1664265 RepID=A0ABZ0UP34_9RICK|nr:hypothetical protein [Candidatus Bandiella woodruffii]WPX96463.1 hypothetical protein Bandiella_00577 [Candidatus Bandiella woodruffii]
MKIFHNTRAKHSVEFNVPSYNLCKKETTAFRSLWGAVITQALMDASSNSKKQKIDALKWLLDEKSNEDFKRVCCLADLEYKEVLSKVKKALANCCKWRNDKRDVSKVGRVI